MKRVLSDFASSIKLQLVESNVGGGHFLMARGEFGRADVPTQNNRKYPRRVWEREIRNIQEALRAGKVFGECDHPCLTSNDFRVLTLDGWKEFKDVQVGDKVWSLRNGEAIVSEVEAIVNQPYSGDAYRVSGKSIEATFTPAHKFVLLDRNGNGEYTATAKQIVENRSAFTHSPIPKRATFRRKETPFFIVPASTEANPNRTKNDVSKDLVIDAKVFAAFMGIYLAEGFTSPESSDNWKIEISQKNEWSKKYIYDEILSKFPEELSWKETNKGFYLADARLYRFLKNIGNQYERYIPKDVKNLDSDCLKELLFWFCIGDGRIVHSRKKIDEEKTTKEIVAEDFREQFVMPDFKRQAFSVSEKLIQDLHECIVLSGGSGSISVVEDTEDYEYAGRTIKAENKVPLYVLNFSTTNGIWLSDSVSFEKVQHDGNIYCLTTTHGNFYMERKGKAFWTGNSDGKTSLKRVSHIMTELEMTPEGIIIGCAKILNNDHGKQLRSILEAGGAIGVSSRGLGSTVMGEDNYEVVQDDYQYITHDFVSDPAVITSYPKFQMEVRFVDQPVVTEVQEVKGDTVENKEVKKEEVIENKEVKAEEKAPVEVKVENAEVKEPEVKAEETEVKAEEKEPEVKAEDAEVKAEETQKEESVSTQPEVENHILMASQVTFDEIKKLVQPFVREEDVQIELKAKDEEIQVLNKKLEAESLEKKVYEKKLSESLQISERLAAKLFVTESLLKESIEDQKEMTSLVGDMNLLKGLSEAEEKYKSAKLKLEEKKESQKKIEEQKQELNKQIEKIKNENAERLLKLEKALRESAQLNKKLGLEVYLERRIAGHPNAAKIRSMCESKSTKEDVDQIIESYKIKENTNDDEFSVIRKRLSRMGKESTLVEGHIEETAPKPRGPVEGSVDQEIAELLPEATEDQIRQII